MELVVVYKSKAKDAMKNPRWEYNNGVYWLRAGSKWTNKGTYLEPTEALALVLSSRAWEDFECRFQHEPPLLPSLGTDLALTKRSREFSTRSYSGGS